MELLALSWLESKHLVGLSFPKVAMGLSLDNGAPSRVMDPIGAVNTVARDPFFDTFI